MTDRGIRLAAWIAAVVSLAMATGAVAIDHVSSSPVLGGGFGRSTAFAGGLFPVCGAVILTRRPRNVIGGLFCFIGFWQALEPFSGVYAVRALISSPGSLPLGPLMAWLSVWTWAPGAGVFVTFLFLLYPDGTLPSRRWRPLAWLSAAGIVAVSLSLAVATWSSRGPTLLTGNHDPSLHGFEQAVYTISNVATVAVIPLAFGCAASIWVRLRGTSGDQREQVKWLAYAAVVVVTGFVADGFATGGSLLSVVLVPIIPVAIAIAIFKYRLYDIDIVITRTLVYGTLAAFITAVYVGIVVGAGRLVGGGGRPNLLLSIAATAVVAVVFQPLRERLQILANRLVYGHRATPYEVLARFSEGVAGSYAGEKALLRMAQVLRDGTNTELAEVWLRRGDALHCAVAFPVQPSPKAAIRLEGISDPAIEGVSRVVLVRHQGEVLGALSVTKRRGESITPIESRLMEDLGHQAGLVLKNVGLTADLQARVVDLRASRQRLVAAQDDERRRLERNLHDGAQQHLVALKVKLGVAEMLIKQNPGKATGVVSELKAEADEALETLRDLARGIYPPLLAAEGLRAALQAQARKATLPVTIEAEGVGRHQQDIEAALYFCIREALQNTQKYAQASGAAVRIREEEGRLFVEVADDGRGFDPTATVHGSGLSNMEDRLDALGGTLQVTSIPGRGTTVRAILPVTSSRSVAGAGAGRRSPTLA